MRKQLHVQVNNEKVTVIDITDDESYDFLLDIPVSQAYGHKKNEALPFYQIEGLRWRAGEHFHLGWEKATLDINDVITLRYVVSDEEPTALQKEEKYIAPEITCSFCDEPKSKVKHLVDGGIFAKICDECVKACQQAIDEKEST